MTNRINAEWHQANHMPRNPTASQRYQWHIEHSRNCDCRAMTPRLKQEILNWQTLHPEKSLERPA